MEEQSVWAIDPVHTRLRFDAKYLMISSVSGWFRELEGSVICAAGSFDNSEIRITIYTNSLFTGVEQRDEHLRSPDFFDCKRFPTIQFVSSSVTVNETNIEIKGILRIKDIEQEITINAVYLGQVADPMGNTKAGFELDAVFDRKEFNISWNQFFDKEGILVSDKVRLHGDIQLLKLS